MDSPSYEVLDFQNRINRAADDARWVVPQEVLEQGYVLSQSIPEGSALVLQAVLETKEQET